MDYSILLSSPMDVSNASNNTLSLFDDSPVRVDASKVKVEPNVALSSTTSNEVASNKLWLKDESGALLEELNRVTAENKRLTEMLTVVCENYNDLKRQLVDYVSKSSSNNEANNNNNVNKKRKVENNVTSNGNNNNHGIVVSRNNGESSSSDEEDSYGKHKEETIKAKITRVAVRTEASDSSLILKDGYHWRKYGQKVTRDNPCPRAYFKCSFAPSCPVKKKVQRSLEDQSMLVATYEGEHNHAPPTQQEGGVASSSSSRSFPLGSVQSTVAAPTVVTLGLTKPKSNVSNKVNNSTTATATTTTSNNSNHNNNNMFNNISNPLTKISSPEFQKLLSEQMASCLTRDPNFTAALAAAITGRFAKQSSSD